MKKDIPVHLLKDSTSLGLVIERFMPDDVPKDENKILGAHRDDHYIFFVLEKGSGSFMIDFQDMYLGPSSLYYILPAQVHHRIRTERTEGWFIAVDTLLIPPAFRDVFENKLWLQQPYKLTAAELGSFNRLLGVLLGKFGEEDDGAFYLPVIHALLKSFLAMACACYHRSAKTQMQLARPADLSAQFKRLLSGQIRSLKSPAAYAAQLNVSESYLNEVLKKATGFPVSYWIQQEVMMEAKRLLYYSQLNVKEIAHLLGYADHSYFSRFFRKAAGVSALAFRQQYRK